MGEYMIKTQSADVNVLLKALSADLLAWEGRVSQEADAKSVVFPILEYSIRMTWLGRRNKLSAELYNAINDLSAILLPPEIGFVQATLSGVALKDQDHYRLALKVFEAIWALYMSEEQTALPKPITTQHPAFWQRIRLMLSGKTSN